MRRAPALALCLLLLPLAGVQAEAPPAPLLQWTAEHDSWKAVKLHLSGADRLVVTARFEVDGAFRGFGFVLLRDDRPVFAGAYGHEWPFVASVRAGSSPADVDSRTAAALSNAGGKASVSWDNACPGCLVGEMTLVTFSAGGPLSMEVLVEGATLGASTEGEDVFLFRAEDFDALLDARASVPAPSVPVLPYAEAHATAAGARWVSIEGRLVGYFGAHSAAGAERTSLAGPSGEETCGCFLGGLRHGPGAYALRYDGAGAYGDALFVGADVTLPA